MISMRIAQAHLLLHGYSAIVEAGFSRSLALSRSASSDARVDVLAGFGSHAVLWGAFDEAGEAGRELLDLAGSEDDQAFTTGNYLLAFSVFRGGDGGELRDALAGALGGDDHLVTPSIRLALLALCEVVDGDVEHGCRRAADAVRETLEHDRAGWSTAWTGAFASLALVLAGEAALLLASTEPVAAQGVGLVYTEAALSGCRAWARAATGDLSALAALAKARAALGQLGDVLFRLVLTLAEIELSAADEPVVSRSLLEVAGGEIEARGLVALEPIRRRLQELLAAGEAASVA
jgi:hypothetical protein